ncbi:MAG: ABC transporter ATP-binding protein [Oscillospiraceae bacterium]|nr:ABC transporter ATP-binding protein [Oscillospiraceae bacterium]
MSSRQSPKKGSGDLRKLLSCVGEYKRAAILTPLCMVGEVSMEILIPFLMSKIIDIGIANGDLPYVAKIGLLMVLMALTSLCFGAGSGHFAAVASSGFAKNIRKKLFDKIQDFSFANVDRFSTASLVTRLTTDVTNTQNAFANVIRSMVRAPLMLICAIFMAVSINAELSLIFLVAVPVLACALAAIAVKAYPRFQQMLDRYDSMNASVQENLVGIRVVKAFVRSSHESEKFRQAATKLQQAQKKAERLLIVNMPLMNFVVYACMIAVSWFGGKQMIAGNMLTGQFFSFLSYLMQTLGSLMMISMSFVGLVMARASVHRIIEVMDEKLDITDSANTELQVADGSVDFEHVSFSYAKKGDNLTLEDVDLHIRSGETIGIIGGTGSAKTTLVQLIPRLYDVYSGSLKVGGRDVREYPLDNLRNEVAMVLQKNVLFSGTIKDNLRWGDANATDEQIEEACRAAQAHDFVTSFPDGYDTDLGQGGVNVSGGQKQRLCIARALLKKPKIIILDDSTSAVDTATDSKIRQALREKLADTTTIIIAQRVASVQDADRIIVLNDGRVDAVGTHEELLASNEIYREVYESQQKGVA